VIRLSRIVAVEPSFTAMIGGTPPVRERSLPDSVFQHYPRIVDMRWYPSSGRYPMRYSMEMSHRAPEVGRWSEGEIHEPNLEVPFYMTNFVGGQPGRFRVKARNKLGESDWSKYRYFEFTG